MPTRLVCISVKVRVCVVREVDCHTGQKTSLFIARDPSSRKLRHLAYAHPIHLPSSLFFLLSSLRFSSLISFHHFARPLSLARSYALSRLPRHIKQLAQNNEQLHHQHPYIPYCKNIPNIIVLSSISTKFRLCVYFFQMHRRTNSDVIYCPNLPATCVGNYMFVYVN